MISPQFLVMRDADEEKKWASIQRTHYNSIKSPRSEVNWAASFVSNLWQIYFASWLHRNELSINPKLYKTQSITLTNSITKSKDNGE